MVVFFVNVAIAAEVPQRFVERPLVLPEGVTRHLEQPPTRRVRWHGARPRRQLDFDAGRPNGDPRPVLSGDRRAQAPPGSGRRHPPERRPLPARAPARAANDPTEPGPAPR